MNISQKNKQQLLTAAKLGIIKQLYNDKLITFAQYQFLVCKYKNTSVETT